MSNQGYEGWFPECLVCGAGNLEGIVCLEPMQHEHFDIKPIIVSEERLIHEDGHWWKCCQVCDRRVHADPVAFGSYAICTGCFNEYVNEGNYPPTIPGELTAQRGRKVTQ